MIPYIHSLHWRDRPTICFLSIKSHILDSNGVWYCSFWSEGSMNPLNMNIWVLDFVPRDLARPRTWYIKWRRGGISNGTFECLHCCEKCLSNSHSRVHCATVQKGKSTNLLINGKLFGLWSPCSVTPQYKSLHFYLFLLWMKPNKSIRTSAVTAFWQIFSALISKPLSNWVGKAAIQTRKANLVRLK